MRKLKKVVSMFLIAILFIGVSFNVNTNVKKDNTSVPKIVQNVDNPKVENVKVLGYLLYPWPGYNIGYAPYFYDDNVVKIQHRLNQIGGDLLYCGAEDGYFGDLTYHAVLNYQMQEGLTQDGIVGQQTWNSLFWYTDF